MRYIFLFFVPALLSACATVNQTYAPDGRKAYTLNCSGLARGWDKCYDSAGKICGSSGYDILDRSDESMAAGGINNAGGFAAKSNERSMMIACKKGDITKLSEIEFDDQFRCPKTYATDLEKQNAMDSMLKWYGANHTNSTLKEIIEFRMKLLSKHHCDVTLNNISKSLSQ